MDVLYTGDIPSDYTFAVFSNDYITLYNKPSARNETLSYYRIYLNYDGFFFSTGNTTFGNNTTYFETVNTSDNWLYRPDIDKIFVVSFICILLFIFVFNIVTSIFKRGGVFSGLF